MTCQYSNITISKAQQFTHQATAMSSSIHTPAVQGPPSDLHDFLDRTNNADLHAPESSANSEENWDVVDKDEALHEQDKDEWEIVGKTAAEKQKQEAERKERMEKQKEERKAEKRKEKLKERMERMKGVSYAAVAGAAVRKF
ncbi:hypothetical protein J4E93_010943 [Alternaria ventricosa]|uniref:uncharacterized protein n=1 Tax=Alternaria ventricosa TaxID=1187951 RepID=UPI0020C2A688|nr:uncharacterized protein J4E93_010943 [Alternaria ventricosa]KAI4636818.1 hypothetical protein J4E93_010943 [Alternaria ventricosa]